MPSLVRTFTCRIVRRDDDPNDAPEWNLGAMPDALAALEFRAELESRVERKLHAKLQKSGREFAGDLAKNFYQEFGISAKTLDGIHRQLQGKLKAISELANVQVSALNASISAKKQRIEEVEKAVRKLGSDVDAGRTKLRRGIEQLAVLDQGLEAAKSKAMVDRTLTKIAVKRNGILEVEGDIARLVRHAEERRPKLQFALHHHKRRLAILDHNLKRAKARVGKPTICWGTRKLFHAQYHLEENGYKEHKDWLRDWRLARSAQFFIEGDSQFASGNQHARLAARDAHLFDLELRLPPALRHLAEHDMRAGGADIRPVHFPGLRFAHGNDEIREALAQRLPMSYRFHRDAELQWFVSVTIRQEFDAPVVRFGLNGVLGVDLNVDHVALTLTDSCGNPLKTVEDEPGRPVLKRRVPLVTYGKTRGQRLDMVRKAAAEIVATAKRYGVQVAVERLDFQQKRAELEASNSRRRSRMLSSFAYSSFAVALERACVRASLGFRFVNPAYTSIIGQVKFARRYGSSVHEAAALAIARRSIDLSERLPSGGRTQVRLASGALVTIPSPAEEGKHVWASWSRISRGLKAVHQGRREARRQARSAVGAGDRREPDS